MLACELAARLEPGCRSEVYRTLMPIDMGTEGEKRTMRHTVKAALAAATLLSSTAYAGMNFTSTWKAPDVGTVDFAGKNVAALVMTKDESVRRGSELLLAHELAVRGVVGIPAYTLVPTEVGPDKAAAKALLEKAGIQGVVSCRVVGKEQQINSSPGMGGYWANPYYGSMWGSGYWGYGWGAVYDTGYLRTDTIVTVEILVFDLTTDKLIWAAMSDTTNPGTASELIKKLVSKAAKEMKKQGLIKKR
jgi:hypothetical protein